MLGYQYLGNRDPLYERTIWAVNGILKFNGSLFRLGRGSCLCINGECTFGNRFMISGNSSIICRKEILFGNDVLLSWDVQIMDTDYHDIYNNTGKRINEDRPIVIGDNVWLGCRALVLKGSSIPSNSIIAAGSTIAGKMYKSNCIYASNGRIIKEDITWKI